MIGEPGSGGKEEGECRRCGVRLLGEREELWYSWGVENDRKCYLVCATHRSGSNLLCQVLWHTNLCGRPQEFFSPTRMAKITEEHGLDVNPDADFSEYLRLLMEKRSTENGVFGGKIMWAHVEGVVGRLGGTKAEAAELLAGVFPNLRYIRMRRADKLRQAISLWKAKQTKVYNSLQAGEAGGTAPAPVFDFGEIRKIRDRFVLEDEEWGRFFSGHDLSPYEVRYETFAEGYPEETKAILDYLQIPVPSDFEIMPLTYRKLADAVNEEWREKFLEMEAQASA